jgi:hypothetical protein
MAKVPAKIYANSSLCYGMNGGDCIRLGHELTPGGGMGIKTPVSVFHEASLGRQWASCPNVREENPPKDSHQWGILYEGASAC